MTHRFVKAGGYPVLVPSSKASHNGADARQISDRYGYSSVTEQSADSVWQMNICHNPNADIGDVAGNMRRFGVQIDSKVRYFGEKWELTMPRIERGT